jgi:hypothetical protein
MEIEIERETVWNVSCGPLLQGSQLAASPQDLRIVEGIDMIR